LKNILVLLKLSDNCVRVNFSHVSSLWLMTDTVHECSSPLMIGTSNKLEDCESSMASHQAVLADRCVWEHVLICPVLGLYEIRMRTVRGMYGGCIGAVWGLYKGCMRAVWGLYEGCMRSILGLYEVYMRAVWELYEVCMRSVLGLYEVCIRAGWVLYEGYIRAVWCLYEGYIMAVWGLYEGYIRAVWGIQWGRKVFSQPPIVQVLPLKKMRGL
jgi:hypothetical protein